MKSGGVLEYTTFFGQAFLFALTNPSCQWHLFHSCGRQVCSDPSKTSRAGHPGLDLCPLFLSDQSYKCQIILPPSPGQTQQHLGQGFMVIIPELEARSRLPNNPNSAPAAVTELPLSSRLSMTSEPGLSNSTKHPLSTCCKETSV